MRTIRNHIKNKNWQIAILLVEALLVLIALTSKRELMYETGMTKPVAELINRLSTTFVGGSFSDVFVFIGAVLLIKFLRDKEKGIHLLTLGVSGFLAFIYICSLSFMMYSSMTLVTRDIYQIVYSIILFLGTTLVIYYLIRGASYVVKKYDMIDTMSNVDDTAFFTRHIFLVSFIIVFAGWLFWIVCIYPGTCSPDAVEQLYQFFGGSPSKLNKMSPPLSTYVMGIMVRIGQIIFKSGNVGFFMYIILQTVVGAVTVALGVLTLKKYFKINNIWLILIDLFFALVPFWGVYAAFFEKSLLYTELITIITIMLMPVIKEKDISLKRMITLIILCLVAALLRNNGIYAIVPTLICIAVYLKKAGRKKAIIALVVFLVSFYGINNALYSYLGIQEGSVAEALSLPFQQTAKYVKFYGNEVTIEEKEAIDDVLDFAVIGDVYNYNISNPVKETYKGDNSKLVPYLVVWAKMFFKHPGIYFSAFMDSSYGYIAPVSQSIEVTTNFDYSAYIIQEYGLTHQANPAGVELTNSIRNLSLSFPLVKYLCMPGLYTWGMILAIILLIKRKQLGPIIVFIPSIINVLVCFASPLSSSMRYSHPTVMAVPFLLGVTIYYNLEKDIAYDATKE